MGTHVLEIELPEDIHQRLGGLARLLGEEPALTAALLIEFAVPLVESPARSAIEGALSRDPD